MPPSQVYKVLGFAKDRQVVYQLNFETLTAAGLKVMHTFPC